MARPKKDNADYFSHDADMRNDPKIKALRRKFSFEGYAIWCFMLEVLTDSDHFEYEWNDLNIELLAGDFDCDPNKLVDVVNYCLTLKLFEAENGFIYSIQHRKRFDSLLSKRKRDRSRVIASENPQSKVKESKVKESKVKESKEAVFKDHYSDFVNQRSWHESLAMKRSLTQKEIIDYIKEFLTSLTERNGGERDCRELKELQSHFVSWLNKKIEEKKNTPRKDTFKWV